MADFATLEPLHWAALTGPQGHPLIHMASYEHAARRMQGQLVYLATPYSKLATPTSTISRWDPRGADLAAAQAASWLARFILRGVCAVSPVIGSHRACASNWRLDPLDGDFWARINRPLLRKVDCLAIPPIDGWDQSLGIWREVGECLGRNVPVWIVSQEAPRDPENLDPYGPQNHAVGSNG